MSKAKLPGGSLTSDRNRNRLSQMNANSIPQKPTISIVGSNMLNAEIQFAI